jgi:hypothetical protein
MRRVFVNRSLDYNEGWKRLLPEEILEVLSKRTNDLLVVSSFQTCTRPKENLPPKLRGRKFPNDRKPLADIVAEGYFRERRPVRSSLLANLSKCIIDLV